MSPSAIPALFSPIKVGNITLSHRVVLSPLTRYRADKAHVHSDLGVKYYEQRASVPGTLLITEATLISPQAGGYDNVPGIWNEEQIRAWRKITDAVHAKGSYIFLQLWALGRQSRPEILRANNPSYDYVSASPIALTSSPNDIPRELTKDEIKQYVQWYAIGAANAIRSGFDGVEVHGANGYLIDQFLQDVSNKRTDEYGGSIENRARFALEVMDAVVASVGATKAAIRLSPWNTFADMGMKDPVPTYTYLVNEFNKRYPDLAYLHVVAPTASHSASPKDASNTHFINKIWAPRPVITTGGYERESGMKVAEETGQLVGFGQKFLANPDLPYRLRENIELNPPDFGTFFTAMEEKGYTTYPFSESFLKSQAA